MADGLSNIYAYTLGSIADSTPAFLQSGHRRAYLSGCTVGQDTGIDDTLAYSAGKDTTLSNTSLHLHGQENSLSSKPSYLHGLDTHLSSVATYLRGSINQSSSNDGYTAGVSHVSTAIHAYADCQPGNIVEVVPSYCFGVYQAKSSISAYAYAVQRSYKAVYISGNLFGNDYQNAFVNGMTANISGAIHAYIPEPVFRSSLHTTFGGITVAATDFVWFKTSDAGATLSKKFHFIADNYDDGTLEKAEKINKTIGGGLDHSVGGIYKTWSPIVKVRHVETETDFGNRDDLEYFWSLNDPNGTPSNDITFIDHHQTEYVVHMVGKMTKNLLGTQVDGECAWYLYKINLMRVQ